MTPKVADSSCATIEVPEYAIKEPISGKKARFFNFELMRVFACYMVIQTHSGEVFVEDFQIRAENGIVMTWYNLNSICRADVPLFMMISGYFLFPIKDAVVFYKRRFGRILIPFAVWSILYAFYYYFLGKYDFHDTLLNIPKSIVVNIRQSGHLWFIYALLGMYLYAPILSPWVETTSARMMQFYIFLWACSLNSSYLHFFFPQLFLDSDWPVLHYFSGNLGFILTASYLKRFHPQSQKLWPTVSLGIGLTLLGYALTVLAYFFVISNDARGLLAVWMNLSPNVALMTVGLFLAIRAIHWGDASSSVIHKLISDISSVSYGMYLSHYMTRDLCYHLIDKLVIGLAFKVPIIAISTFFRHLFIDKINFFLAQKQICDRVEIVV